MTLPAFRYHPDPVGTGSALREDARCDVCERDVNHVYEGPLHGGATPSKLCLGCIADGTAARALGTRGRPVDFNDVLADVPAEVADEVRHRTPGFFAWQAPQWLAHCGDAAAYLGRAGADELAALPDARADLVARSVAEGMSRDAIEEVVGTMHADGDATAYLFRCLHCGTHLAYWDAS